MGAGLGSNLPGRIARKVSPSILGRLSRQRRRGILAVSGTNGKSTTSGLIYSILRRAGFKTVHNRQGANLVTGITATLLDAATWDGRLDADYCLFEIDEAALPVVAREMDIAAVVVTNLFRDQLDRFGELDTTARLIESGIVMNNSQAILNADDPNVEQLAAKSPRVYFGIESVQGDLAHPGAMELSYCPKCGKEYSYDLTFYGQLGHYRCAACSYQRPAPSVSAHDVSVGQTSSKFNLKLGNDVLDVELPMPGLFNVYNALAAAAITDWMGIAAVTIKDGLEHYSTLFGRSEKILVEGRPLIIQLIKNPAGATQVVNSVARDDNGSVLICINDNLADGRDISWLWDAEFELLGQPSRRLTISGQRAQDMAVRMKYAGVDAENITVIPDLEKALRHALAAVEPGQTLWLLPTYTCLLELQKIMKKMGHTLSGT
jgi:UDP-N-acetylmuramyl tripeptide synthase